MGSGRRPRVAAYVCRTTRAALGNWSLRYAGRTTPPSEGHRFGRQRTLPLIAGIGKSTECDEGLGYRLRAFVDSPQITT